MTELNIDAIEHLYSECNLPIIKDLRALIQEVRNLRRVVDKVKAAGFTVLPKNKAQDYVTMTQSDKVNDIVFALHALESGR